MIHPESGDVIVFNGEIYNFAELREDLEKIGGRFTGHSDTEILLHGLSRWGTDYLSRLNGMFAFAFFSKERQELLLARDSAGIKPLYIARAAGAILFASEVRALLASGLVDRSIDRKGLASYMAFGSVQRPFTLFEQISEFDSGTYELFGANGSRRSTRFWNFPRPDPSLTFDNVIPEIRQRLAESVRDQMVADVPVGVFLSSGIDSTLIAALASSQREGVRAFTVGFKDQPDLSEQVVAAEIARGFGIEHTAIDVTADDALAASQSWLGSLDQPSVDGLNVFIISQAIRQQGIKVALAGNGGDELFAGYSIFWEIPLMMRLMSYTQWLPPDFARKWPMRAFRSWVAHRQSRKRHMTSPVSGAICWACIFNVAASCPAHS